MANLAVKPRHLPRVIRAVRFVNRFGHQMSNDKRFDQPHLTRELPP
jgi:hypothetical protein